MRTTGKKAPNIDSIKKEVSPTPVVIPPRADTTTMQPAPRMAMDYLKALTGGEDKFVTFQTIKEGNNISNKGFAKFEHLELTVANLQKLFDRQKNGEGIFAMVNKGDGKGRKTDNVVKVRALFIDLDGAPWQPAANMLQPHMRVESSPGRYHLYWFVSDCALEEFKPLQQAIALQFDGDSSCVDLPRVLRVPGFYHMKTDTPFMTQLVELNDLTTYTTQAVIDGLRLILPLAPDMGIPSPRNGAVATPTSPYSNSFEYIDPLTGEVTDLIGWAAKNPDFNIISAINPQFFRDGIKDGKQHITCPFENEHTGTSPDFATFVANASPHNGFTIKCMHSHCIDRDRLEFLSAMLESKWIEANVLHPPAFHMKRPPYVNYCANEITAELQLRPLQPDEFRILLQLMHIECLEQDGMLPDDNWNIERIISLPHAQWIQYREILIRTGWLSVENGRILNPITKREFDKAQKALNSKITGGSNGGKIRYANLQSKSSIPSSIP